jgi:predicted O-methyltransferase YrrM
VAGRTTAAVARLTLKPIHGLRRLVASRYHSWRDERDFRHAPTLSCDTSSLTRDLTQAHIDRVLSSAELEREWLRVEQVLASLDITDTAGGVNPGDRRAIYYLVRGFGAALVLEIGTHIGASTLHIAAALKAAHDANPMDEHKLTTVDVVDVNDRDARPWIEHGSRKSPAEMAHELRLDDYVTFVTAASSEYFADRSGPFDFIFLDGDHSARAVYSEVPAALPCLQHGGVILLHDYFPELRPLWSDGAVIPGPWAATERLRAEGCQFRVLPLGELPWPTKLNSRTTSLALLVGV